METTHSSTAIDRGADPVDRWASLESYRGSAFLAAGVFVLTSLVVPLALSPLTSAGWIVGLVLVGLGTIGGAIGVLGLFPALRPRYPWMAVVGAGAVAIAGLAAAALVGVSGIAIGWMWVVGAVPAVPKPVFLVLASLMAVGYGLGFLVTGLAGSASRAVSTPARWCFVLAGTVLLVSAGGALLRMATGIGLPPWTVVPSIVVTGLATVGVGVSADPATESAEGSGT